ncbi:hypothetical protein THAOC_14039 [Thalassiosira oceanica]|uniref:Uncharacterized protein n=1 Tax=Thalassiosira oceanica TaxID=159749 RepID=K0SW08_THAOC|nr:hypothetical protein THAOC_14039 [Thalassiosira oceanica]|eukprot:EJK65141.1 hypothetical protein THAOC_14039 [Thalassiosira oceanica]
MSPNIIVGGRVTVTRRRGGSKECMQGERRLGIDFVEYNDFPTLPTYPNGAIDFPHPNWSKFTLHLYRLGRPLTLGNTMDSWVTATVSPMRPTVMPVALF